MIVYYLVEFTLDIALRNKRAERNHTSLKTGVIERPACPVEGVEAGRVGYQDLFAESWCGVILP